MKENKILAFKITILLLMAGCFGAVFTLERYNKVAFWWTLCVVAVLCVLMIVQIILAQRNIHKFIAQMDMEINSMERDTLFNFPLPTIIVDAENTVIWYNKGFTENIFNSKDDPFGIKLESFIEADTSKLYSEFGTEVQYKERWYRVRATKMERETATLSMIYFEDITEYYNLEQRCIDSRVSVILIMIDNYGGSASKHQRERKITRSCTNRKVARKLYRQHNRHDKEDFKRQVCSST